jgi:hypothetical protein
MLLFLAVLVTPHRHLHHKEVTAALEHLAQAVAVVAVVHQAQVVTEPRLTLVMAVLEHHRLLVVHR